MKSSRRWSLFFVTLFPYSLVICSIIVVHPFFFLVTLVTLILVVVDVVAWPAGVVWHRRSCRTVLGVVDLPAQAEVLAALVGSLGVAHLKRHGGVVALVCAQLVVINGTPRPRSGHASLGVQKQMWARCKSQGAHTRTEMLSTSLNPTPIYRGGSTGINAALRHLSFADL